MSVFQRKLAYNKYGPSDILAYNLRDRLEYGLIELGAYTSIDIDSKYSRLQRSKDSRYEDGQVYEGLGPSWVWQEDVSTPSGSPDLFRPSGVFIDGTFYDSSTSGAYAHNVDYRNGRVIFDSPLSGTPEVKTEYCFNNVGLYTTDSPHWKTIIDDYIPRFLDLEDDSPDGLVQTLKQKRLWLPALFIDVQDTGDTTGLQLGGGHIQTVEVGYHVFAEKAFDQKNLSDLLNDEHNRSINLYDINKITPPLDSHGFLNNDPKDYKDLSDRDSGFFWTYSYVEDSRGGQQGVFKGIYRAEITHDIEISRYLKTF